MLFSKINIIVEDIIDFILYPEFSGIFLVIKIIFIVASLGLIIFIIYLFFATKWFRFFFLEDVVETFVTRPYGAKESYKEWAKIKENIKSGKEEDLKMALIEASDILDSALKKSGFKEESLGEKLEKIDSKTIKNIDKVIEAYNIRNDIVYNPGRPVSAKEVQECLSEFELALRDLKEF